VPRFEVHTTEIVTRVWNVDAETRFDALQRIVHRETEGLVPSAEGTSRLLSAGIDGPESPADWRINWEPGLDPGRET
jgi:hypothetical protein